MGAEVALAWAALAVGGATAADSYSKGRRAEKNQDKSQKIAEKQAEEQAFQAEREMNAANKKAPDAAALLKANKNKSASTLLTSPTGAPGDASLGRNTLLGA